MLPVFPDVSPETVTESKQPWQGRTLSNLKKSALLFPVLRGTIVTDEGCFFDPSPPGFSPLVTIGNRVFYHSTERRLHHVL